MINTPTLSVEPGQVHDAHVARPDRGRRDRVEDFDEDLVGSKVQAITLDSVSREGTEQLGDPVEVPDGDTPESLEARPSSLGKDVSAAVEGCC